ncbi:MAG: hypothetical protein K8T90_09410 [Planctomycetes bacterium]|nr:hypothetical protein [Planctomycetota bacterium]
MTGPNPNLACARSGLLDSLRSDGAATPDQLAELAAHHAACAACRGQHLVAARVDRAVGDRLRRRAAGSVPSGFAGAVVAAAVAQRAQALAENRFLRRAAAAAVLVALVAGGSMLTQSAAPDGARPLGEGVASARDAARTVVFRPRFEGR